VLPKLEQLITATRDFAYLLDLRASHACDEFVKRNVVRA